MLQEAVPGLERIWVGHGPDPNAVQSERAVSESSPGLPGERCPLRAPSGATGHPPDTGVESGRGLPPKREYFRLCRDGEASPAVPSWNQLRDCLLQLDLLRKGVAA
jgi:hypothetical protein